MTQAFYSGKSVLITGAASGIGALMAEKLALLGAQLFLLDRDEEGLRALCHRLKSPHPVHTAVVDLSDAEAIRVYAESLRAEGHAPTVLLHNAGIVAKGQFHEQEASGMEKVLQVNALAPILLTRHLLPAMQARQEGAIAIIASAAGLVANPGMAVYASSKWAAVGWADSLHLELKRAGSPISVTTVMPYYISTGMFEGVRSPILPILKPERVAERILKAVARRRRYLSMPLPMRLIRLCQGILPLALYDWLMGSVLGIYSSMDHFVGRSESQKSKQHAN
ncbi:short-chain dehydrogenase/reductase sdr [Nitritalea halalkaliphila LW7]|uniref:Short-chain dehydrogenase/reductase sdr n=1 Tax=Nitritalea halalkaliphila LW7 TaxID=1189621 RepID=I5BU60_9BACT|nr:SDR family NAD(P)-dependent oxidoreductase [Nitritalea halalkaliphila]EIM73112.1 short-chain dehydrogenase/reductase sdr [Nitritalea halalkaliphila LW7]